MPPEVGYAETSSLSVNPISRMNAEMIGQPHEIATGPPLFQACPKVVKQPARIEMIENEMAKLEKLDQVRLSSWEYPSRARCFSSSLSSTGSTASGMGHTPASGLLISRRLDPRRTERPPSVANSV